jgi:hypothetical protein
MKVRTFRKRTSWAPARLFFMATIGCKAASMGSGLGVGDAVTDVVQSRKPPRKVFIILPEDMVQRLRKVNVVNVEKRMIKIRFEGKCRE